MAKKKIDLFINIKNEKEFEHSLKTYADQLICAEIYCAFAGSCTALDKLFIRIKLDWSNGRMVLLKVPADEIQALKRFRNHSEPVYMFILNHRVTKVFRGVNSLKFAELAKREWIIYTGGQLDRPTYPIKESTPDETEWIRKTSEDRQLDETEEFAKRAARQAARKRHRAELMVPHLQIFNFVLFWPHCYHAHPELYEKWDDNNIIMVGREEVSLTEEMAIDVLYAGDAPLNEASLHKLLSGPALAICFRLLDTDKHFVSLVRKILYEDLPAYDDSKPADAQSRMTAFDLYKTYSPTREEVMERRRKERIQRREETIEKRARRLSEMQRLAQQNIEDTLQAQKKRREDRRLELLKSGNLEALKKFDLEPDEEINIEIPEDLPDDYEEEESDEDPDDEHLPPPGLLIPGFYSPPNDVAKANGLAVLFPKIIADYVTPEPEFLPPHILVMLEISKAYQFIDIMKPYQKYIINMGIFKATSPFDGEHIAYSVKQYETLVMDSSNQGDVKLVVMLSIEQELPLLLLSELAPAHVSRDEARGAIECAALFPVDYDTTHQREDFYDDLY